MFSVGIAKAASTRRTEARDTLDQAARGSAAEMVGSSSPAESDPATFCSNALRREMAPDEFMAMASLMGRDYAVPLREARAPSSSSAAAPLMSEQSGPARAKASASSGRPPQPRPRLVEHNRQADSVLTSAPSSLNVGSPPTRRRATGRHWPAGALPPRPLVEVSRQTEPAAASGPSETLVDTGNAAAGCSTIIRPPRYTEPASTSVPGGGATLPPVRERREYFLVEQTTLQGSQGQLFVTRRGAI